MSNCMTSYQLSDEAITMKVGTNVRGRGIRQIPEDTAQAENLGYDFISTNETKHNPFLAATLASEHSTTMNVRTSIALAFARSPMDTAPTRCGRLHHVSRDREAIRHSIWNQVSESVRKVHEG